METVRLGVLQRGFGLQNNYFRSLAHQLLMTMEKYLIGFKLKLVFKKLFSEIIFNCNKSDVEIKPSSNQYYDKSKFAYKNDKTSRVVKQNCQNEIHLTVCRAE